MGFEVAAVVRVSPVRAKVPRRRAVCDGLGVLEGVREPGLRALASSTLRR